MTEQPVFVPGRLSPGQVEWVRRVFKALFWLFAEIETHGIENLPTSGGFMIAPNHLSVFDPPLVFLLLNGRRLAAFAGDTYRARPFFRWIIEMIDTIWVNRGATSPKTVKAAIHALREGRVLGLAPEGTRSLTGALIQGKTGAAYIALAAGVPIVPAAVTNTEHLWASMKRLKRIKLTVTFGKPLMLNGPKTSEQLELHTTEIMCQIAALLPPKYRGVYAEHPRLKALLSQ